MPVAARSLAAIAVLAALVPLLTLQEANAQVPGSPPSTVWGSITSADGEIPEGVEVEAIVNGNVCGTTETVYAGEGEDRVTSYVVDVHSARQTSGCGNEGDPVFIRVDGQMSEDSVPWEAGPVNFDVTFGGAQPRPVPTFTPTPEGWDPTPTPTPAGQQSPGGSDDGGGHAGPPDDDDVVSDDGSGGQAQPGSGDDATDPAGGTDNGATDADDAASSGDGTPADDGDGTPGLDGELSDSTPESGTAAATGDDGGSGSGFPVWGILLLAVGGIAVVGGGIGFVMARANRSEADDEAFLAGAAYEDSESAYAPDGDVDFDDFNDEAGFDDDGYDFDDEGPEQNRI